MVRPGYTRLSRLPFGLSYGAFAIGIFLIGNFVMVDSPRFPKSSGIGPKKALLNSMVKTMSLIILKNVLIITIQTLIILGGRLA